MLFTDIPPETFAHWLYDSYTRRNKKIHGSVLIYLDWGLMKYNFKDRR